MLKLPLHSVRNRPAFCSAAHVYSLHIALCRGGTVSNTIFTAYSAYSYAVCNFSAESVELSQDVCEGVGRRLGITIRLWIFWDRYPVGLSNIGPAPTASRQTEFHCQHVTALIFSYTRPAAVPAITGHLPWSDAFLLLSLISESFFLTCFSLCNISCFILSVQFY